MSESQKLICLVHESPIGEKGDAIDPSINSQEKDNERWGGLTRDRKRHELFSGLSFSESKEGGKRYKFLRASMQREGKSNESSIDDPPEDALTARTQ